MTQAVRHLPTFGERYELVCEHLGSDVLQAMEAGDGTALNGNLCSSLMTVLVSSLLLDVFRERSGERASFVAGYSVGQWSAMYAAEMLSFPDLLRIVAQRAKLMDACVTLERGAMCAVIGVAEGTVERLLAELRAEGNRVFIGNYNCFGQYSISGSVAAVELAEQRLAGLKPKKLMRLPVAGAWHCPLLTEAAEQFLDVLEAVSFEPPCVPVVDNVTGGFLPQDEGRLKLTLARHLDHPVRWEHSIKQLVAQGCSQFAEIGFGEVLTKFGFFIDRESTFRSFCA